MTIRCTRLQTILALFPLLTVAGSGVWAQPATPGDAPAQPAVPAVTGLRRLPNDVTVAELSNGLTIIVQENHVAPVATVRCYVKNTGGAFEGKYLGAGLSHVLEHVVAGGTTKHRSEDEIELGGVTYALVPVTTNRVSLKIEKSAQQ